jgi:MFS family permease
MNWFFSVGGFSGAMFVGWACDYLGRKKTLLVAWPIAIAGGALQGSAVGIAMFLVGHLLGGFAVGAPLTSVFLYVLTSLSGILVVLVPLLKE